VGGDSVFDESSMKLNELCIAIGADDGLVCCELMLIAVSYRYLGGWGNLGEFPELPVDIAFFSDSRESFLSRMAKKGNGLCHRKKISESAWDCDG
jgi:hypothetical protein